MKYIELGRRLKGWRCVDLGKAIELSGVQTRKIELGLANPGLTAQYRLKQLFPGWTIEEILSDVTDLKTPDGKTLPV